MHGTFIACLTRQQHSFQQCLLTVEELQVEIAKLRRDMMRVGEQKVHYCKCFNNSELFVSVILNYNIQY